MIDAKETAGVLRITEEQMDSLPLSGRVFTDLALLDSSVQKAAPGVFFGERGTVFTVNGQSGRSNSFLVDGLDNNDQTSGTTLNAFYSQQVIDEFVLLTHQYAPEFGSASGGVLNIITKRGTNELGWGAFVQGSAAQWNNSGDFVDSLPERGETQDSVESGHAGFNFSGPFKKDRAFFFVAYEHMEFSDLISLHRPGAGGYRRPGRHRRRPVRRAVQRRQPVPAHRLQSRPVEHVDVAACRGRPGNAGSQRRRGDDAGERDSPSRSGTHAGRHVDHRGLGQPDQRGPRSWRRTRPSISSPTRTGPGWRVPPASSAATSSTCRIAANNGLQFVENLTLADRGTTP